MLLLLLRRECDLWDVENLAGGFLVVELR